MITDHPRRDWDDHPGLTISIDSGCAVACYALACPRGGAGTMFMAVARCPLEAGLGAIAEALGGCECQVCDVFDEDGSLAPLRLVNDGGDR
jgi:hypothetical protein